MHKARCLLQTHFAVTCVGREKTFASSVNYMRISCIREIAIMTACTETWSIARRPSSGRLRKKDKNRSELISKLDTVDKGPKWSSMSRPHFDVRNWEFISIHIARSVPRRENFTSFDSVFGGKWKLKILWTRNGTPTDITLHCVISFNYFYDCFFFFAGVWNEFEENVHRKTFYR